jgi:hypothetical protein
MRRLPAAAIALLLAFALTACSDDGGDEASAPEDSVPASGELADTGAASSAFCTEVEEQAELFEGSDEGATEDDLAAFDELVAAAPQTIQPDLETVRDAYVQISELEEDDLDSIGEAFDILFDVEFIGAIEQVGIFLEGECGIDIETPSEAGLDDLGEDEGSEGSEEHDEPADDGLSADGLRAYVEAEDADLESRIQTVTTVDGFEVSVGVRNLDDPTEAVGICEVVSGYVYDEVGDADVTVKVSDTSATTLAERAGEHATCESAPA